MKSKKPAQKPYWEMTTEELAEATKEFDEEFVIDKFGPPPPEARARWEAAKRKGETASGDGAVRVITIGVDKDLLARSDRLAKKMRITRAELVARALKAVLAVEGEI